VVRFLVRAISAALRSKALLVVENLGLRQQLLVPHSRPLKALKSLAFRSGSRPGP
jgi:hypothetical protein